MPVERVALVTGGGSGVGEATARLLARRGLGVVVTGRRQERLDAVVEAIRREGGDALAVAGDVRSPGDVDRAVRCALDAFGRLDLLVTAAGVAEPRPLAEMDDDTWRAAIDTNLTGTALACRAATPALVETAGAIVTIGSELATKPLPGFAAYGAAKAGVLMLTRVLALELAPHVRVNCVCPGPIDNEMLDGQLEREPDPQGVRDAIVGRIPLRRLATCEDVAEAVAWAGLDARFSTGAAIAVDGGSTL